MRIVHITHELPPYETAGTAIYTHNIAQAQAKEHDVFVFARLQDPTVEPYRVHDEHRDGLHIRFMNLAELPWDSFRATYEIPRAEHILRTFLEEVRPDVIHFQHIMGFGRGSIAVAKSFGVPVVFTLHDFWNMCPMGQRMCYTDEVICDPIDFGKCGPCVFGSGWDQVRERESALLEAERAEAAGLPRTLRDLYVQRYHQTPGRFARRPRAWYWAWRHRNRVSERTSRSPRITSNNPFEVRYHAIGDGLASCDLLITPSAFLRDRYLADLALAPEKIIYSANGMDFSYVKALPKTPSPRLRIGFIGSILRTKGVHVLLDAFLSIAGKHPNVDLHVHGAPNRWTQPYLEACQAKAAGHPEGHRVTFHGRFDNRRIGETLADIDLLVVPSIWYENAPLTLNEAAMTGTPIVVSDRGGMLEFVEANGYGRTFELGNSASLARVLDELATDPSRIAALGGSPPPIKPVSANARELVSIYRDLIARRYRPPTLAEQAATRGGILATH